MDTATRGVVGVAAASAVAASTFFPGYMLMGVTIVLAALFSIGWPKLLHLPSPRGSGVVITVSALLAILVVLGSERLPYLYYVTMVLVAAVILAFVHEMLRGAGRTNVVSSVAGTVSGAFLAVSLTAWVPAAALDGGLALVVTAAVCLALIQVVALMPLRGWLLYVLATIVPIAGAIGMSLLLAPLNSYMAIVISVTMSLTVLATTRLLRGIRSKYESWSAGTSVALMNVAAAGMITYVTARVFLVWLV